MEANENHTSDSPMTNRPLVTFALFTYNQEEYIGEAIKGALSQTYSPLEIIISDDCSTDRTFEITQAEVSRYSGPHNVILNRNPKNLGIGPHINQVMRMAKGELIIDAAGDDISLPHRVEKTVLKWKELGMGGISMFSSYFLIDENGRVFGEKIYSEKLMIADWMERIRGKSNVEGASHAWSASLFRKFGELAYNVVNEDVVIQFRASLLGGVAIISEPLVQYRKHQGSVNWLGGESEADFAEKQVVFCERSLSCLKNFKKDVAVISESEERCNNLLGNQLQDVNNIIDNQIWFICIRRDVFAGRIKILKLLSLIPRLLRSTSLKELGSLLTWCGSKKFFFWVRMKTRKHS